jgi:5-methylcytosine-specific restriction endonuclease McrA
LESAGLPESVDSVFPQIHNNNYQPNKGKRGAMKSPENQEDIPQRMHSSHTRKEWLQKLFDHGTHCHYCEVSLTTETVTKDHLTPLCRGGSDTIDNIVPACLACNQTKAWRTEDEFLAVRPFLSTGKRARSYIRPCAPSMISLEERFNEPGLLKKVVGERERVSWAWRNPYPEVKRA